MKWMMRRFRDLTCVGLTLLWMTALLLGFGILMLIGLAIGVPYLPFIVIIGYQLIILSQSFLRNRTPLIHPPTGTFRWWAELINPKHPAATNLIEQLFLRLDVLGWRLWWLTWFTSLVILLTVWVGVLMAVVVAPVFYLVDLPIPDPYKGWVVMLGFGLGIFSAIFIFWWLFPKSPQQIFLYIVIYPLWWGPTITSLALVGAAIRFWDQSPVLAGEFVVLAWLVNWQIWQFRPKNWQPFVRQTTRFDRASFEVAKKVSPYLFYLPTRIFDVSAYLWAWRLRTHGIQEE